jgi:chitinase
MDRNVFGRARIILRRFVVAIGVFACVDAASAQTRPGAEPRIVGYYFAPRVANGFPVSSIDGSRLTHINYAFANIAADGRAVLGNPCFDIGDCAGQTSPHSQAGGNFAELRRLKRRYPHLRTLISIGGWSWSARFSDAASTPEARRRFVASAVTLFIDRHPGVFDGIDLDWEYPVAGGAEGNVHRATDRENYTSLLRDFRNALDQAGRRDNKRYLLTIAAPAGSAYALNYELFTLGRMLDFINVMTYDYHTGGSIAHFNAPLGSAKGDPNPENTVRATVDAYLAAGVPKEKLVVGVAFFGYGYAGVGPGRNGVFQPLRGSADRSENPWTGALRYRQITQATLHGFTRYWEPDAGVPWLYNVKTRTWITYDDAQSLALKADLVRTRGLGGIMIWELSGDDGTLLPTIYRRLRR